MAAIDEDCEPSQRRRGLDRLTTAARALPGLQSQPSKARGLQVLTAAALALPGLMQAAPAIAAEGDNALEVQFGQFRERPRDLYGLQSKFAPIESDGLHASGRFTIADRWKALINFRQDTWSGATPVATAPREWRGNRSRSLDGVSGATPYLVNSSGLYLDKATLQPLATDGFGQLTGGVDNQLVHTMTGASREVRKQLDFRISHEWDEAALDFGAGTSLERDYTSRWGNIGGRFDFNQKLTTVNVGLSYTSSSNEAVLDHDATPYIFNSCGDPSCNFFSNSSHIESEAGGKRVLKGDRHDWGAVAGITQVLNQNAQLNASFGYTRARGYLSNPYKVVQIGFVDPDQQFLAPSPDVLYVYTNSILDKRPDSRDQWQLDFRYAQYVSAADAALHLHYGYFHDDWGVKAHTMDAEWVQPFGNGWTVTPRVRYYTQSAADFYVPYLVTNQALQHTVVNPVTGRLVLVPFDLNLLPSYYSSDHRLSAYGALSGGLSISKQFAKGVTFALGYEYYKHAGSLKWGGGGEGSYSDFSNYLVNATLKFDMDANPMAAMSQGEHAGHAGMGHGAGHDHAGMNAPAGVMFNHLLNANDFMVGARYMFTRQAGNMMRGSDKVDDAEVKANGCEADGCMTSPTAMNMHMYMLELMYAPTNWVTLMLMPMYMDMTMNMKGLLTQAEQFRLPFDMNSMYEHHTMHEHQSGGIGDTGIYASFKLFQSPNHNVIGTLGVTAPTGSVDVKLRPTHQIDPSFQHYHMQLGSGTWDFNPSITYSGVADKWFWGAQASGTVRMESRNDSGYALGSVAQGTLWGGYQMTPAWSATLRGLYTRQGAIRGEINDLFYKMGPVDYPSNYGGRFWDVGVGVKYSAQSGAFANNQFGVEWLQPVKDDFNGFQLERRGGLQATWMYMF